MNATPRSWALVGTRCAYAVLLGVVPAMLMLIAVLLVLAGGRTGSDFTTFWDSGRAVLHGRSPYPSPASLPQHADRTFAPFVYPPVAAFSMVPLSILPFPVASILFFVLDIAAVALALRLLGVRDWRCYGVVYLTAPVFAAAGLGTMSPLLLLGVAAAWRYRDRAFAAGLLVAYVATAKLFLWPLWLWLIRTRRFRAAAIAAAASGAAVTGSWAAIGFAGLPEYPRLLSRLTGLVGPHSYSAYALQRSLGLGGHTAQTVVYVATAVGLAACALLVADDRQALAAALGIALLATPILWPHYLVLLFVPLALVQPSFSPIWLAPLLFWLDCSAWSDGAARIAGVLVLSAAVAGIAVRRSPDDSGPPGERVALAVSG